MSRADLDVSVVLTFTDDEEIIGNAVRRVAEHLRSSGLTFEIVAVDEDSGDNSHAVLALVRSDVPELRVIGAPGRDRGFAVGARQARARVLWLIDAEQATSPLAPFGRAYRIVARGQADAAVVSSRFAVCYRGRCVDAIEPLRGRGDQFHKRLERRLRAQRLEVAVQNVSAGSAMSASSRPWSKLLDALTAARTGW